jgi:hypothetical protein
LVLVVATLGAVAVAAPARAQEGEPGAAIVVNQVPGRLEMSASGCFFAPGSPVGITFSGGGGDSRQFSRRAGEDTCFAWSPNNLDPCRLGASDLPGTRFRVTVDVPSAPYSLDQLVTLDPDTTNPRFLDPPFDASPRQGSKVEVGDEINFEVTATDKTPAPSWQTGVHSLQVTGPQGLVGEPQDGGRLPKACGEKSKSLTVRGSHQVKRSDPAVIELCAIAEDYLPNTNSKCAQWYKGEVWEGTVTTTWQTSCIATATSPVQFAVEHESGKFETTFTYTEVANSCGAPGSWGSPVVPGRVTRNAMTTTAAPVLDGRVARSGDRIDGTYTGPLPGGGTYATTWELQCVSCGDDSVG